VIAGFVIPSPGLTAPKTGVRGGEVFRGLSNPGNPELLIVPSIKLRAPVVPILMVKEDGANVLHPPSDYHEVGWWQSSAKPGSATGQTLITGHTVHTGGGVMNELGNLRPGAEIDVKTKHATIEYYTTKVFVYTKAQLSKHADELFGQDRPDNRLVLVTCTGWTGSYYTSNIIVFATPVGFTPEHKADPSGKPTGKTASALAARGR
jgi:LPXTG-site transpeptidase (sortase) family protein